VGHRRRAARQPGAERVQARGARSGVPEVHLRRFTERRLAIEAELAADGIPEERRTRFVEDRDEYAGHNVFWVPADARWDTIQARAKLPSIGQDIDTAMDLIEKENPVIRGVLPRNYGREGLDKGRLGQLVDLIGSIGFTQTDDHGSDDVLGRVYEYFLGQFAGKETGKDAGAFYTPRSVVRTLVEMLEPFHGRVYDPCCGSGGMFVESAKFVQAHNGARTDVAIYGQEFTDATCKLAKMNLALRGIEADLGERSADSFGSDLHPDLARGFHTRQPSIQRVELVGRQARRRPPLDVRRTAAGQRQFRLGAALRLPPVPTRDGPRRRSSSSSANTCVAKPTSRRPEILSSGGYSAISARFSASTTATRTTLLLTVQGRRHPPPA